MEAQKTREQIPPREVKLYADHFGWPINNEEAGLFEREGRGRNRGKVVCKCGNGPDPAERPAAGLYVDEDQGIRMLCGACWLVENAA